MATTPKHWTLARKFVTELEAVQRDVKSNTQRIAAIEQRISPPWATRALRFSSCGHHRRADTDRV